MTRLGALLCPVVSGINSVTLVSATSAKTLPFGCGRYTLALSPIYADYNAVLRISSAISRAIRDVGAARQIHQGDHRAAAAIAALSERAGVRGVMAWHKAIDSLS